MKPELTKKSIYILPGIRRLLRTFSWCSLPLLSRQTRGRRRISRRTAVSIFLKKYIYITKTMSGFPTQAMDLKLENKLPFRSAERSMGISVSERESGGGVRESFSFSDSVGAVMALENMKTRVFWRETN